MVRSPTANQEVPGSIPGLDAGCTFRQATSFVDRPDAGQVSGRSIEELRITDVLSEKNLTLYQGGYKRTHALFHKSRVQTLVLLSVN